jgi:hypothetical protein
VCSSPEGVEPHRLFSAVFKGEKVATPNGNAEIIISSAHGSSVPEPTSLIFVICQPMRRILYMDLDAYAAADPCILFMKLSID